MTAKPAQFKLPEEEEKKLKGYIHERLEDCKEGRDLLDTKLRKLEKQYESVYEGESNFPWPKSANPRAGVTQYCVDSIFAILLNVLRQNRKPWVVESNDAALQDILEACEDLLQWEAMNERGLNLWPSFRPGGLESCKFGTGILKVVWEKKQERVRFYSNRPDDKIKQNVKKARENKERLTSVTILEGIKTDESAIEMKERDVVTQGPKMTYIPFADFFYPLGYNTIQKCPWVAERFRVKSDLELEDLADELNWDKEAVEKVKSHWHSLSEDREDVEPSDKATGQDESDIDVNTFFEFWMKWRFEKDPLTEEEKPPTHKYVITYHAATGTIMCRVPHPNDSGIWPYFGVDYTRRTGKIKARGVPETIESEEKEINTIRKQRRDAATAAVCNIILARRDSGLDEENTELFPQKILFMDNPKEDMQIENMGRGIDIAALIADEDSVRGYVERKTGLTEFNMGKDMGSIAKGRAAATSMMAQIRENQRRLSDVLANWRETLSDIGLHVLELYRQYAPFGKIFTMLGAEKGDAMEKFLLLPQEPLRGRLLVRSTATDEVMNEEIRRQSTLLVNGILNEYYKQVMELATALSNPNAPPEIKQTAMAVAESSRLKMDTILEEFRIRGKEKLLITLPKSFDDLSKEAQMDWVKGAVNMLKGKGATIDLVDTTQQGQGTTPPAAPGSPLPMPPAAQPYVTAPPGVSVTPLAVAPPTQPLPPIQ